MSQAGIQIGKHGLTSGVIESLENAFKKHDIVKIHVLKSAGHTKENLKEIQDKLKTRLGNKYLLRIVGFTIFIKKLRKPKKR
jgi:RNA-binding protein YhbY